jgi:monofunctional biosynthetic peptidoglycan transglycosylase
MRVAASFLALLLAGPSSPATQEGDNMLTVVELDEKAGRSWQVVNDGVMGGLSRSRISFDECTATFEGTVSLENNGGFASVRTQLGPTDLSDWDGIALSLGGEGRTFQLRIRTNDAWDGVAYRARFVASDSDPQVVRVPFSAFEPTRRGRVLEGAEPLDPSRIEEIGFLIADGHEGDFRLRVEWIRAYRVAEPDPPNQEERTG